MVIHQFVNAKKENYLTISVNHEISCVVDVWDGTFGTQENFRMGLEKVVEVLKEHKLSKWLADLRNMRGSWDSSREWMSKELMPKAIMAGLKYEAVIIPKDVFSKLSTKDTIMKLGGLELRQFDDYGKAVAWLQSVN